MKKYINKIAMVVFTISLVSCVANNTKNMLRHNLNEDNKDDSNDYINYQICRNPTNKSDRINTRLAYSAKVYEEYYPNIFRKKISKTGLLFLAQKNLVINKMSKLGDLKNLNLLRYKSMSNIIRFVKENKIKVACKGTYKENASFIEITLNNQTDYDINFCFENGQVFGNQIENMNKGQNLAISHKGGLKFTLKAFSSLTKKIGAVCIDHNYEGPSETTLGITEFLEKETHKYSSKNITKKKIQDNVWKKRDELESFRTLFNKNDNDEDKEEKEAFRQELKLMKSEHNKINKTEIWKAKAQQNVYENENWFAEKFGSTPEQRQKKLRNHNDAIKAQNKTVKERNTEVVMKKYKKVSDSIISEFLEKEHLFWESEKKFIKTRNQYEINKRSSRLPSIPESIYSKFQQKCRDKSYYSNCNYNYKKLNPFFIKNCPKNYCLKTRELTLQKLRKYEKEINTTLTLTAKNTKFALNDFSYYDNSKISKNNQCNWVCGKCYTNNNNNDFEILELS